VACASDGAAPAPEPGGRRTHAPAAIDTANEESAVQERGQIPLEVDVVIAGAGPVGATLALDLAQRGVQTLLLERSPTPRKLPKMERCNPRTMEIFRRLGVADTLREASAFTPVPMDVFVVAGFERPPLLHLRYPSVPEAKEIARNCTDGSVPLEPQQLVSQYTAEPILRRAAVDAGAVLQTGAELVSFEQDADGVTVDVELHAGGTARVRCRWLVGADGGVSTVRKGLGIRLEGDGRIKQVHQVFFRSERLFDAIPFGRGRHYYFPEGALVVQDDLRHFVVNFQDWVPGQDAEARLRALLDLDVDIEVLHEGDWYHHLLVAERYRDRRVFLAGDAAHLVIPQGGLGMNTGVGDAIDLGWKLAAAVHGYAGEHLLQSYEDERREVGLRNREASRAASGGVGRWRAAADASIREDTPAGDEVRARVSALAAEGQPIGHELLGVEAGYRYTQSPVILVEPTPPPVSTLRDYIPTATPGARLPHVWLEDGRPVQDALGPDYSLLVLRDDPMDTSDLQDAFARYGAGLSVLHLPQEGLRKVYECDLLLVRPDLHVVWRGTQLRADLGHLAAVATGHADGRVLNGSPS
jgi:2-polyprenyl-6-methoxyphenol hydroxylase-like FAD-dependent oxidoreductase